MTIYKLTNAQKLWASVVLMVSAALAILMSKPLPEPEWRSLKSSTAVPVTAAAEMQMQASAEAPPVVTSQTMTGVEMASNLVPPGVQAVHSQIAWQTGNLRAATPNITLNERIVSYAVVELDPHPEHMPAVGEQVQLPMLNGQQLVANVESATTTSNGDYSWSGHLQGYGTDYPVVMTYGEHSTFATITTPEGSYTLESLDGLGWLYKNPAEIELSAPGAKDYLDVDSTR